MAKCSGFRKAQFDQMFVPSGAGKYKIYLFKKYIDLEIKLFN